VDQDREKWLKWRQDGIGSSDGAAIMGFSPYKTEQQVFEDKVSDIIEETNSFIMNKGNELEPIARAQFAARYNMEHDTDETFDAKICQMTDLPFMRASLDGCSKDGKTGIECKYQGKQAHAEVSLGVVPKHYWIQMQHQMLVAGLERNFLVSINDGKSKNIFYHEVRPDEKFLKEYIVRCTEFWERVIAYRSGKLSKVAAKPEASDQDFVEVSGDAPVIRLVEKWKELKGQSEAVERQLEIVKQEILNMKPKHPRVHIAGVNIVLTERKGNVNYTKIPELKNVDLEKYRGMGSTYYTFKVQGEK
jgi:putative phage-type endonuclease